ncbi:glycosyltransferase family 4 protein [Ilyomonas limi]|uniref:Glycosyltransferase family 4 protein n=1 Tax=Ilyomonas limi TaxID=2575867 RepID=A0A4U3L377_9BACT|nr:glycosyltransferase family 1 protein [Ilyomonas limi]TKK68026.1 glycosyltransferase family 4 protein [Ilyomonas limi]
MTIYFDNIVYSLQTAGGISVYWYELSKRWLQSAADIYFIERANTNNIFRNELIIPNKVIIPDRQLPLISSRYLPVSFTSAERCIFHSSYYRTTNNKHALPVVTVHDFTYEKMRSGIKKKIHQSQKKAALDKANGIICISENTKKDMLELYPYLSKKKIAVIYNGVSESFFPITDKQELIADNCLTELADKKYVVFIGSREDYKNFSFAVHVLRTLEDHTLVMVGGGLLSGEEETFLQQSLGDRWQHFLGINNNILNKLYNFAQFLLYPSAYEGFGIPVIEAERAGCPVIALNASSIPEIAGNKQLLLHTTDVQECIAKMNYLQANRSEVIANGIANSRQYSWDICFDKVKDFYQEVLNS